MTLMFDGYNEGWWLMALRQEVESTRGVLHIFLLRLLSVVGVWLYWSWHCFVSVFGCLPEDVRYLLAVDWILVLMLIV